MNGGGSKITAQVYRISLADSKQMISLEKEQKRLADAITLSYIKLMTACKRVEGIKEARNVFKQARKFEKLDINYLWRMHLLNIIQIRKQQH